MDEYIDKKAAINSIASNYCMDCENSNGILCRACEHQDDMDIIDSIPAADVQFIHRGRWENGKCTICNKSLEDLFEGEFYYDEDELNFCPNCGADMRKLNKLN